MTADPPIIEIAFSLTFEPLDGLTMVDLADLYRDCFQAEYPTVQHAPPVGAIEVGLVPAKTNIELWSGLEIPRLWFVTADTHGLVQLQRDRIAQNWRRIHPLDTHIEYPRYSTVRGRFEESVGRVQAWLASRGIAHLPFVAAELAYINAIPMVRDGQKVRISDVLAFYRPADPPFEMVGFNVGWTERAPEIAGTTSFGTTVGAMPGGEPSLNVNIVGRCPMTGLSLAECLARFDLMHDNIHRVFGRAMTPEIVARAAT